TNESEFSSLLNKFGFEICFLERLSFNEQVTLFQEAETVISPHGSGLANLVFCSPGTKVVELFPARATDAYFRLCVDMNLTYTCLKTREWSQRPRVSDDFSINVDDLKDVIATLRTCSS
ncbi:MAG: glycosyltransferase family 61 protein, partial [Nitrospirales bacterium]